MRPLFVILSLWFAAPSAGAGTIQIDPSVPFAAVDLSRALAVRTLGGAGPCAVIAVRMVTADVASVACDQRAVLLRLESVRADDAARAVALTLLALGEPGIGVPPWTFAIEDAPATDRPIDRRSWHFGVEAGFVVGAGPADRGLGRGRVALERRARRWRWGLGGEAMYRGHEGSDPAPAMRAVGMSAWAGGTLAGVDLAPMVGAALVELEVTAHGRIAIVSVGVRAARRLALTGPMSLGLVVEPTVAIRRLTVEGGGQTIASTPRFGLGLGVELTWKVAP